MQARGTRDNVVTSCKESGWLVLELGGLGVVAGAVP